MIHKETAISKVFGGMATVFHRTRKEEVIDFISKSGFKPSHYGSMYGKGVYCTYDLMSQLNENMLRTYGPFIVKGVVDLSRGFILFDNEVMNKVWGRQIGIDKQLKTLGVSTSSRITSEDARKLVTSIPGIEKKISGLVFTGNTDGKVVVVYDPNILVPVSWTYSDDDYLNVLEQNINWNKMRSYVHLRKSLRAMLSHMSGGTNLRHTVKDPDWDGSFTWINGVWVGGIWDSGVWLDGVWHIGTFKGGVWHDGIWLDGRWKGGIWRGGTFKNGIWYDGIWEGGIWEGGAWLGGIWKGGYDKFDNYHKEPPNLW